MAFQDTSKANIPFKRTLGKVHTANDRGPANEPESSNFQVLAQLSWGEYIDPTPATAIAAGVITPLLTLDLVPVSGTNNSGKYSAYWVKVPAVLPPSLSGKINPRTGQVYAAGDRIGNIVPQSLHANYTPKLFKGATETPPLDASDWFMDTDAGVVTQETDDVASMIDYSTGGTVQCYVYVGKTVAEAIKSAGAASELGFVEKVQTVTTDGEAISVVLDSKPDSELKVYLNGILEDSEFYTWDGNLTISIGVDKVYTNDKVKVTYMRRA